MPSWRSWWKPSKTKGHYDGEGAFIRLSLLPGLLPKMIILVLYGCGNGNALSEGMLPA